MSSSISTVYGGGRSAGWWQGNCFPNWKNTASRETESGLATLSCFCTNLENRSQGSFLLSVYSVNSSSRYFLSCIVICGVSIDCWTILIYFIFYNFCNCTAIVSSNLVLHTRTPMHWCSQKENTTPIPKIYRIYPCFVIDEWLWDFSSNPKPLP